MIKILILILFTSCNAFSQSAWDWFYATPTTNDYYSIKFIDNNTGFIGGAYGTLLKTTNGGTNWKFIETGEYKNFFSVYPVNQNVVYALCTDGNGSAIYKSSNGGNNWLLKYNFSSNNFFASYFFNADTGYIAGQGGVILYTTNGGSNWIDRSYIVNMTFHTIVFLNNQTGYIAGWYNNYQPGKIFIKTTNGGINWSNININGIDFLSSAYFKDVNTGFVCGSKSYTTPPPFPTTYTYEKICRTTDGGTSWDSSTFSNNSKFLNMGGFNNTVYVFGENSPRRSTNCGLTWDTLQPITLIKSSCFLDESKGYLAGSTGKIAKLENYNTISILNKSLTNSPLQYIRFTSPDTGYIISNSAIYKSTNSGFNWVIINPVGYNTGMFSNNNLGIANTNFNITYTINGGTNWTVKNFNSISPSYIKNCAILPNSKAFAVGDSGLIINSDNLFDWNYYRIPNIGQLQNITFTSLNTGYITSNNTRILKSTNGGTNWVVKTLPVNGINGICFLNDNTGFISSVWTGTQILKTTNGGDNWVTIFGDIFLSLKSLYFSDTLNGFAIQYLGYSRLYYTSNGGTVWNFLYLHTTFLNSISFANSTTGFISGDNGTILRTTTGGISFIQKNINVVPKKLFLYQNYPNPFNPVTKIKFDIAPLSRGVGEARGVLTQLKIYDITGREVKTLVNEQLQPGTYEVTFDGSNLPSGVYFYQLRAGDFTETKKLILLK
jgi:photosystem II stability/assembly factor-like uncharacterized protein